MRLSAVMFAEAPRGGFSPGMEVGRIQDEGLAELSGVAASRRNPGVLWVHNDNTRDKLYAVSTNGQLLATYKIGRDVTDGEDIAIGPGPAAELDYLYFADIGDNTATRPDIRVFRAPEPAVYSYFAAAPRSKDFNEVESITLRYPEGSRDAEALLIDPLTGDLYIATKEFGLAGIYRAGHSELRDGATVLLQKVLDVSFHQASAGDISVDGREIVLRQEDFARLWRRTPGQTISEALQGDSVDVPVIGRPFEPNGEGIAFHPEDLGYFTISEGPNPSLFFFPRAGGSPRARSRTLVPPGSSWRYLDDGSNPGILWRDPAFSDTSWRSGAAQFGYGDDDEQTLIGFGSNKDAKHVTSYFRKQFTLDEPATAGPLSLSVVFDDGIAVYLNGAEVLRRNLSPGARFSDTALSSGSARENLWQTFAITNLLRPGANLIAAEVHRRSRSEGDLSFDLQLVLSNREPELGFAGPPQQNSPTNWVVTIHGPGAGPVQIERSADMRSWTNWATVTLTNRVATFPISPSRQIPQIFYRLRR